MLNFIKICLIATLFNLNGLRAQEAKTTALPTFEKVKDFSYTSLSKLLWESDAKKEIMPKELYGQWKAVAVTVSQEGRPTSTRPLAMKLTYNLLGLEVADGVYKNWWEKFNKNCFFQKRYISYTVPDCGTVGNFQLLHGHIDNSASWTNEKLLDPIHNKSYNHFTLIFGPSQDDTNQMLRLISYQSDWERSHTFSIRRGREIGIPKFHFFGNSSKGLDCRIKKISKKRRILICSDGKLLKKRRKTSSMRILVFLFIPENERDQLFGER